jgi:hypothetical protein
VEPPFIATTTPSAPAARRAAPRRHPEQRRHLARVGRHDDAAGVAAQHRRAVAQLEERGGVEDDARPGLHPLQQPRREQRGLAVVVRHARPEQQGVAPAGALGELVGLFWRDPAARRFVQPGHERLGHRQAQVERDAAAGGDLQLAGPGPERADAAQQRPARHLHAARHHQHPAALVLVVPFLVPREGHGTQEVRRHRHGIAAHRAPTETSGSAVTGAPSCSKGAAKL